MLVIRKLLDLHIGNDLYTLYECKGEFVCAYQIFIGKQLVCTFTDLFKCSRYLLDKWEEVNK